MDAQYVPHAFSSALLLTHWPLSGPTPAKSVSGANRKSVSSAPSSTPRTLEPPYQAQRLSPSAMTANASVRATANSHPFASGSVAITVTSASELSTVGSAISRMRRAPDPSTTVMGAFRRGSGQRGAG